MFKAKRVLALLVILALVVSFAAGCGKTEEKKTTDQPKQETKKEPDVIKIAVIAPLTGNVATFGQSTKNAVELLVKETNAKGGINGKQIKVVYEDDKNDPVEGANAAQKVITQDKVVAIIGSVASKVSLAIAPITQQNKIPQISPTSTNDKLTLQGDFISRACFKDSFQGYVMAKFDFNTLKAKKAAVLFDVGNDYSKGLAESFKANFEKLGGKVVAWESYSKDDQDFNAQLTKISGEGPDVLFVPDYYDKVGIIAKQAKAKGIKAPITGGDGFDSDDLVKIGGSAVEGVYFSNHYSPEAKNPVATAFIDAYKKEYKTDNAPDALAALAYDAGLMLFDAIKKAGSADPVKIKEAINATKDLQAVSGKISLDKDRNPIKPAVIITIKGGKQAYVEQVNP
ncbi:MAG: ABC transporter substrate-binding protein [Actinobacteria bacterium]|nr:ABC transporter substrate-binding protein [Actinomycetota bacterium]